MNKPPLSFDPQHVATFLAKIDRDREATEAAIAEERDQARAKILADAHAESRRVFRRAASEARARRDSQTTRVLARVRSDLLRQRWNVLAAAQERALAAIWDNFLAAWHDPDRQAQWCLYWLREGIARAGGEPLEVRCGAGVMSSTLARLDRELAQHNNRDTHIRSDDDAEPGIVIEWGDYILDGRLRSQCPAIARTVLSRLARLLGEDCEDEAADVQS